MAKGSIKHFLRSMTARSFLALGLMSAGNSMAADSADVDRLTSYAVMLGRGVACGMGIQDKMSRVGGWIDSTFEGRERSMYLVIFSNGVRHHADMQKRGETPDSCGAVRQAYLSFPWP
jgi:hypothetical protein